MIYPHGLSAILSTYGNPFAYVDDKAAWESQVLVTRPLRYRLPYAYRADVEIGQIRAHRLIVDVLVELLAKAVETGVPRDRLSYGGCYCWRPIRGGRTLSTHTWGMAVDLDPLRNPLGEPHRPDTGLPLAVVELFTAAGWTWGGAWSRPDAQHFQAAGGY